MESTLRSHYEVIEVLHWSVGEFAQTAYKAREIVSSSPSIETPGRVMLMRLLPSPAAVSDAVRAASEQYASLKQHPNILSYFGLTFIAADEGQSSGEAALLPGLYAVSEWSRGISLKERIRRVAPFSLAVALDVAISVTQALIRAEEQGVAHGDLRAEEIILTPEGQVKVADFALGRAVRVAMGDTVADERPTRSIARLMVEMLTAEHASPGHEQQEISLSAASPAAPPAIDGIVRKASMLNGYMSLSSLLTDLQTAREDARGGRSLNWSPLAASEPVLPAPRTVPNPRISGEQTRMAGTAKTGRPRREPIQDDPSLYDDDDDYYTPPHPGVVWLKRIGLLVLGLAVIGAVFVAAYFAMQITDVPSDVTVPNLIGKQFSDAQTLAQQQHFNLVEEGHQDSDTWPQGAIYQQTPTSGRSIKSGKDVQVFVSDGPRLLDVPDLSQTALAKAQATLGDSGLPVGSITYQFDSIVPKGIVTTQEPAAGAKVSRETAVNLTVSKGPPPPPQPTGLSATSTVPGEIDLSWDDVSVPATFNVYRDGKKIASALPQTTYSDVTLDTDTAPHSYTITAVDENGESQPSAAVTASSQPQNTNIDTSPTAQPGDSSAVDNSAAPPPAPSLSPSPGAPKQRQFHILFRVPRHGDSHLVQIEVQDTTGTNVVYDEDRSAGDIVDESFTGFGNKVIFRIFIDGKLVKQQTK